MSVAANVHVNLVVAEAVTKSIRCSFKPKRADRNQTWFIFPSRSLAFSVFIVASDFGLGLALSVIRLRNLACEFVKESAFEVLYHIFRQTSV
jgi:hypothetical protein